MTSHQTGRTEYGSHVALHEFKKFTQLPRELQSRVWELACPGPRLIEVYPRPHAWDTWTDEIVDYKWQAHRCECEDNCPDPFIVAQVCQESRRVFKRTQGRYARCFGTWIDWKNDILYIGDRTGHLHNANFLRPIERAGGYGKVKNLAIHEDVWQETFSRHGNVWKEFKSCSPMAVLERLGVKNLTIVGKAGFFRDGTEFFNEVDERAWLWNDDSEIDDLEDHWDLDEDEDEDDLEEYNDVSQEAVSLRGGAGHPMMQSASHESDIPSSIRRRMAPGERPREAEQLQPHSDSTAAINPNDDINSIDQYDEDSDEDEYESDDPDHLSELSVDDIPERCDGPIVAGEDPRIYKPRASDGKLEQHRIPTGESGLALVDFSRIVENGTQPLWKNGSHEFLSEATIKASYLKQFERVKRRFEQWFHDENDPGSTTYIDWSAWTPPTLKLAFFRRTGQSCRVNDWKDLEKDYITWQMADMAKRRSDEYLEQAFREGWYEENDVGHLPIAHGAMEGYNSVAFYAAKGKEVPCTATNSAGKSCRAGNYYNTTAKFSGMLC